MSEAGTPPTEGSRWLRYDAVPAEQICNFEQALLRDDSDTPAAAGQFEALLAAQERSSRRLTIFQRAPLDTDDPPMAQNFLDVLQIGSYLRNDEFNQVLDDQHKVLTTIMGGLPSPYHLYNLPRLELAKSFVDTQQAAWGIGFATLRSTGVTLGYANPATRHRTKLHLTRGGVVRNQ